MSKRVAILGFGFVDQRISNLLKNSSAVFPAVISDFSENLRRSASKQHPQASVIHPSFVKKGFLESKGIDTIKVNFPVLNENERHSIINELTNGAKIIWEKPLYFPFDDFSE